MKPQRKIIRLRGYDYRTPNAYFVTICVHRDWRRRNVWGVVEDGAMRLNRWGRLVWECWDDLPNHHQGVVLDAFVVMPNHVHALLHLQKEVAEQPTGENDLHFGSLPSGSLSAIVGSFKSAVTRRTNLEREQPIRLWQPRFYERIVRTEHELEHTRHYIWNNPSQWPSDQCHPAHPDFNTDP